MNERIDSRNVISDYIFFSKYSRVKPDGKKESWTEAVSRVMQMHHEFLFNQIDEDKKEDFYKVFNEAWNTYNEQLILGSQRSLQYGGPQLLKNNFRSFNCSGSYCNRIEFFKELMELLLSGCVPPDTPILTENGIKRFDEVKVGEKVWSYNKETGKQELKSVIATHDIIVKSEDQIKISGSSGYFVTSKKHPVLVLREGKWEYLPAGQIKIGDIIRKGLFDKSDIEFNERAYFVGSFLGDGTAYKSPKGNLTIKMNGDNKEVVETFASLCSKYSKSSFNVRLNKTEKYSVPVYETDNTISAKNELAEDWNKLIGLLPGNKAAVIDAPEWIKKSYDKSIILSFLAGLIDTDGWIGKEDGRICYSTVSKKMKDFLMEYLPMFNIYPWCFINKAETYTYNGFKPNCDIYMISFSLKGDDCFSDFVSFLKHPLKKAKLLSTEIVRGTKKIAIPYEFLKREADYLFDDEKDRKKNRSGFIYHASEQMFVKCAYYHSRQKSYKHLIEYDRVVSIEDDLGLDENFKDLTIEDNHSYIVGYGGQFILHNCGTGYSIQKIHTDELPILKGIDYTKKTSYIIEDSIEGWALSTGMLIEHYYEHKPDIEFDYSQIREEGAFVSGGFKAPGPEPLKVCHHKIKKILEQGKGRKLRPFELHLISCIIADAVISGGIRRSAMICIFDIDDDEMLQCKTSDWFTTHPELCRCNNSVAIYEDTPKEKYDKIFEYIQQYGEPGILFLSDNEMVVNPCCFAGDTLIAVADGRNAVSIKELAESGKEFPVYYKTKKDSVKITNAKAFCTGEKDLIEIVLSDKSSFRCTRDHFLRLKNGDYVLAEQSLGQTLSKFYSVKSVKYRTINSCSNGFNRQYRMIWEFNNGPKPKGFEIDHINDEEGDFLTNLELLSRDEHLKKTAKKRKGINNPRYTYNQSQEELDRISHNSSINSTLENNNRYKGLSNIELIEVGKKTLEKYGKISYKLCNKVDERFPLGFSKNRFDGKFSQFRKYVLNELEYNDLKENRVFIEKPKIDYSEYTDDVTVIEIKELNIKELVYDIETKTNEHNFAIITEGKDNYMYSKGVFVHNCEAALYPRYTNEDGSVEYGWSFCNLTEINGKKVKTEEDFYKACRTAAILGTFQAAYTKSLPLLSEATRKIMKRDALLGVGITGMADNPNILFNERIQRKGAHIVIETNKEVANILGINNAARTTVIKPSGNASQLLGCGSGIHAYHFRKYIRNIQANNQEQALKEIAKNNPDLISPSFWNKAGESVISFPIELDKETMVRTDFSTIDFLHRIYTTEKGWIMEGTNREHPSSILKPKYHHNVSCTVSVKDDEWKEIADWIWEHREGFCGLSFLPETGDLDYPQAPYTSYLDEKELAETYGQGAILSSGLIVDGLQVFGDIWTACNAAIGRANNLLIYTDDYLLSFIKKHMKDGKLLVNIDGLYVSDVNAISSYLQHKIGLRNDWVRRFKKFSKNYFNGDDNKCASCLKHVNIFHQWQKIKKQEIVDWENVQWEQELKQAGDQVGTACSGGACELK